MSQRFLRFQKSQRMSKSREPEAGGDEVTQEHTYGAAQSINQVRKQVGPCVCEWGPLGVYWGWTGCPYPLGDAHLMEGCEGSINEVGWGKGPPRCEIRYEDKHRGHEWTTTKLGPTWVGQPQGGLRRRGWHSFGNIGVRGEHWGARVGGSDGGK